MTRLTRIKLKSIVFALFLVFGLFFEPFKTNPVFAESVDGKTVLVDGASNASGSRAYGGKYTGDKRHYSYANYLANTHSMKVNNVAVGGAGYLSKNYKTGEAIADKKIIPKHLTSSVKNTSYDYILIRAPYNDLSKTDNVNNINPPFEDYLQTITSNPKWAKSKIGLIIIPHPDYSRSSVNETKAIAYLNNIRELCKKYSVEVLDLYNWDSLTKKGAEGSYDGRHASAAVQDKIGKQAARWMETLPQYKYEVSFDLNGLSADKPKTQQVVHGKTATKPSLTVKDSNQEFKFWATTKDGKTGFNFSSAINKDTTLYAIYEKKDKSGGSNPDKSGGSNPAPDKTTPSNPDPENPTPGDPNPSDPPNGGDNPNPSNPDPDDPSSKCVKTILLGQNGEFCPGDDGSGIGYILNIVVTVMTFGVGALGVLGILISGIQYMTANGNEMVMRKAKRRLIEVVVGLVAYGLIYALLSWLIPGFG